MNFDKSKVMGIEVEEHEIDIMVNRLRCGIGSFPFTYLGVSVGANMNKIANLSPLNDKFNAKLST